MDECININDVAVRIIQATIENPGSVFNPLFIIGGSKKLRGKLLQAYGYEIFMNQEDVLYSCSELDTLIQNDLLFPYDFDVLLLDGIKLDDVQEEYLHRNAKILMHYISINKQIVFSLDLPLHLVRKRVSCLFPIPQKSLFLDVSPNPGT